LEENLKQLQELVSSQLPKFQLQLDDTNQKVSDIVAGQGTLLGGGHIVDVDEEQGWRKEQSSGLQNVAEKLRELQGSLSDRLNVEQTMLRTCQDLTSRMQAVEQEDLTSRIQAVEEDAKKMLTMENLSDVQRRLLLLEDSVEERQSEMPRVVEPELAKVILRHDHSSAELDPKLHAHSALHPFHTKHQKPRHNDQEGGEEEGTTFEDPLQICGGAPQPPSTEEATVQQGGPSKRRSFTSSLTASMTAAADSDVRPIEASMWEAPVLIGCRSSLTDDFFCDYCSHFQHFHSVDVLRTHSS